MGTWFLIGLLVGLMLRTGMMWTVWMRVEFLAVNEVLSVAALFGLEEVLSEGESEGGSAV